MNRTERPVVAERSPEPALVDAGQLRTSILAELPALLSELGQDPDRLLGEVGLDPVLFRNPENPIAFRVMGNLLAHCVGRTGCRDLGLRLGMRGRTATLGVVGLLVENSPDVGTALRNLVQYLHLHDRGAVPTLATSGNNAILGYAIYEKDVPATDHICAGAMAIACNIMRELCGADWRPGEVLFPFRKPSSVTAYSRFFRSPLRFDAHQCALVFPDFWLGRHVGGADPGERSAAEVLVARLEGRVRGDLVAKVRRLVRVSLLGGSAKAKDLAAAFAMHRRTLNRRLKIHNTTYQKIVDEVRFEVACQMLRDTDIPVGDIAISLGYADASPFGRAFRRWSGITPVEWRTRSRSTRAGA